MLQRADITGARPVILVEAATPAATLGDAKQEALDRLSQLALGKEFQAQVLSRLADGSYLVQIDDAIAGMKLPPGTQTGDIVELTLVATEPRPTFLLGKPGDTSTASLSPAARLIADMLQLAQKDGAAPTALIGKTPLLASADTPVAQIANALRQALGFSGLFYESHVAQWANGTRPQAELLKEATAKLLNPLNVPSSQASSNDRQPQATHPAQASPRAAELDKLLLNMRQWVDGKRALSEVLQEHIKSATTAGSDTTPLSRQDASTVVESAKLLSLQLDTLEQRRIVWQGELFPGQHFEWDVSDDTPRGSREQDADGAPQSWHSTVRFSLPTLGAVAATVKLSGEHVQVQIHTADARSAATLRSHGGMLAAALDAAGSTLDSLSIKHDDKQDG